jgi:uncharacterized protein (UPF0147 family)
MKMEFAEVIGALKMLKQEVGIPKNLKSKIDNIILILNNQGESQETRVHKAEIILDEVSNDSSLQPFIRTQIYQIVGLL